MKARIPKSPAGGNMLEQIQKMQEDMQKKQAELEQQEYEIKAGGGLLRLVMDGKKQVKELELDPDIVDIETLQDLIVAAVNEAITTVEETAARELEKITSAVSMPNLPGMPRM